MPADITGNRRAERQRRAVATVRAIAARYGIAFEGATILHDSNHTVIHLVPVPLVAKVNTSPQVSAVDEVAIARFLADRGAPVVSPASLLPPGPHRETGLAVTFWDYCPHVDEEPSPDVHGRYLRLLHDALEGYAGPLPAWNYLGGVDRILADVSALAALPPDDRAFLRRRYKELGSGLASHEMTSRVLHGEPHGKNLLLSPRGPSWIDFEAVCRGPQEWDLTMLPDEVVDEYFTDVDRDLLATLRQLRSLCVAAWCWLDPDRDPVLREAGTYHLALLKGRAETP